MDFIKTMLVYMMLVVGSATEASPALPAPATAAPVPTQIEQTATLPTDQPVVAATEAAAETAAPAATAYSALVATLPPTQAPTAAPAPTPIQYTALYVGDRGEDVRRLQRALTEQNYLKDKIDGIFGQKTKRAVEDFERANGMTVDGVAGQAVLKLLYEGPEPAAAETTPEPEPTAAPAFRGVKVPVYYVDENEKLLAQGETTCFTTTTIYANSSKVAAGYVLTGENSATVTVRDGVATPASVTFRYTLKAAPTAAPEMIQVPVYYMSDTAMILHQDSVSLAPGTQAMVEVDTGLVPGHYTLSGASSVLVTMDGTGLAFPSAVIFTFRGVTPTAAPGEDVALVPVRYMNEAGVLVNETVERLGYGQSWDVEADPEMMGENRQLVSESPVTVAVDEDGTAVPAVVVFTCQDMPEAAKKATAAPTRTPSPKPTEVIPTAAPTVEPTQVPVTKQPTGKPTEKPTEAPTAAPTAVPTEAPTAAPTAAPTEAPTAAPTATPTPKPTAVPTAALTEAPTAAPTATPTPKPTPKPTAAPTATPTHRPTPKPTPSPTPEPTKVPVKLPTEGVLQAGSTLLFNGKTLECPWYWDAEGRAMISVKEFSEAADIQIKPAEEFFFLGAFSSVTYENGRLQSLKIAGKDCTQSALYWKQNLYIGEQAFSALGCTFTVDGDTLSIRYK
ncbi:MAG: peptidoglycan-binding protein [Clostridia bacterium]|nr:peptidoglycan-binding protein [Clostridia bacterium]